METVKKRFENRDSIKGFDSGHPVEALAVENWHTILRFMFEIGTALQTLSGAHRAVTLSNVFLRHRLYPPDVSEKVVKTKPFLDRYQAVFGKPCLPEEVDDTTFWKSMDYPRPVGDPDCDKGEGRHEVWIFRLPAHRGSTARAGRHQAIPCNHDGP